MVVTRLVRKGSSNNPFCDSFVNTNKGSTSEQNSNIPEPETSLQEKTDNATQIHLRPRTKNDRPITTATSCQLAQPDATHLVSPRASMCSTPEMAGSDLGQEEDYPSSDESWGMY